MSHLMVVGSMNGGAMKRILLVLVAGAVLVGAGAPSATAGNGWSEFVQDLRETRRAVRLADAALDAGSWRQRECRFQSLTRPTWSALEEQLTAECAIRKWAVSGGYTKFYSVGDCESGWNRYASNGGRYLGLFQHAAAYWQGRVAAAQPDWDRPLSHRWQNSRTQIVVTARMVHGGGWGPWSCA